MQVEKIYASRDGLSVNSKKLPEDFSGTEDQICWELPTSVGKTDDTILAVLMTKCLDSNVTVK